ncbi:MAG: membrane integrity-associated transporter subunit PqiC [Lysobacterales bacterium]
MKDSSSTTVFRWLVIVSSLGLAACGAPNRYLLDMTDTMGVASGQSDFQRIGLQEVTLPDYARGEKIASLQAGSTILQDDKNRWAESPEDAVARNLAAAIGKGLSAVVLVEPYPRGLDPDLQIEVRFDRFVRDQSAGVASLSGQFIVSSGDGRRVVHIASFAGNYRLASDDYAGFVEALKGGLAELANTINQAAASLEL